MERKESITKPISYHVEITADDGYETVDQVGNVIRISAGESIYSKYFNSSSILIVEFSAGNVDFENGMTYTATVTVSMNSGLTIHGNSPPLPLIAGQML